MALTTVSSLSDLYTSGGLSLSALTARPQSTAVELLDKDKDHSGSDVVYKADPIDTDVFVPGPEDAVLVTHGGDNPPIDVELFSEDTTKTTAGDGLDDDIQQTHS